VWFITLLQFKPTLKGRYQLTSISSGQWGCLSRRPGSYNDPTKTPSHKARGLDNNALQIAISMIFLVKSSKMQNLQDPNIEKVLLMIKALNHKTLLFWVAHFLLFHDLWTILFQTFKYWINNMFNFSMCRVQIWPPTPSLVNTMRLFVAERTLWQLDACCCHQVTYVGPLARALCELGLRTGTSKIIEISKFPISIFFFRILESF
jgi:hypothetical protein